ncbi:MAG: dockerin type I domain-containing protein [Planctomycetota bacterium]|jgi:hypothetical protein
MIRSLLITATSMCMTSIALADTGQFGVENVPGTTDNQSPIISTAFGPGLGTPDCPADVNLDGRVNVDDLVLVLLSWGAPVGDGATDINQDGMVEMLDVLVVIQDWGDCPG